MSIFKELKRRNVFRVAVAYLVVGWLLLQVIDTLGPLLDFPESFNKLLFYALIIGFLPTLLFSWAFELTPEGIKREKDIQRDTSITHITAKKLDYITLGGLVLVAGLIVWQQLTPNQDTLLDTETLSDTLQTETSTKVGSPVKSHNSDLALGVAVLPFDNLSANSDNKFFAGGVHEDVLTQLSKINDLRVISRTSMLKVAEKNMEVTEIGKHLGVSHVLEGSVRRAGDQVRVTVQLIDASNDNHIWAENFDRKLDDIFAIQSEIAISIAEQLKAKITPEQVASINQSLTSSTKAYDLYNQARSHTRSWRGADGFEAMQPLLEKAIELDPNFVQAEVMLVEVYGRLLWTGSDQTGEAGTKAKAVLERIKSMHPDTADYYHAKGNYHYTVERDYSQALVELQKALINKPNDIELLNQMAAAYKRLNRFDEGIRILEKAASLDPDNPLIASELVGQLARNNQLNEALIRAEKNLDRFPNDTVVVVNVAAFNIAKNGNKAKAIEVLETLSLKDRFQFFSNYFALKLTPQNAESLIRDVESLREEDPWQSIGIDIQVTFLRRLLGQTDLAKQRANKVLTFVEEWTASGKPLIGNNHKPLYAFLSYLSCLADDHQLHEKYVELMEKETAAEYGSMINAKFNYGLALAECGDASAGWSLIEEVVNDRTSTLSDWDLVVYPVYAHYFSQIPEYLERVKALTQAP